MSENFGKFSEILEEYENVEKSLIALYVKIHF